MTFERNEIKQKFQLVDLSYLAGNKFPNDCCCTVRGINMVPNSLLWSFFIRWYEIGAKFSMFFLTSHDSFLSDFRHFLAMRWAVLSSSSILLSLGQDEAVLVAIIGCHGKVWRHQRPRYQTEADWLPHWVLNGSPLDPPKIQWSLWRHRKQTAFEWLLLLEHFALETKSKVDFLRIRKQNFIINACLLHFRLQMHSNQKQTGR